MAGKHASEAPVRYHHGDLRAALIAAAEGLLRDQGNWNFTLREVARAAGVSHNAPYNHFEDRSALLAAVATRAFDALRASLAEATTHAEGEDAAAQIEAAAVGYVLFAVDQPARFRLMFSAELAQAGSAALDAAAASAFDALKQRIAAGVAKGELAPDPHDTHALAAWSLVHGLSSLILDRRASAGADRAALTALTRGIARTLIDGLRSVRLP
jgi:AcrR family transcriptional regulator